MTCPYLLNSDYILFIKRKFGKRGVTLVLASGLFNDVGFNPCLGIHAELEPLIRLTLDWALCLFNDAELEPLLRLTLFRCSYFVDAELEPLLRLTLFKAF